MKLKEADKLGGIEVTDSSGKPIVLVDFDGVLHSYASGWNGPARVDDEPVPHAMAWLSRMTEYFNVGIYSSRSKHFSGRRAMKKWIRKWLLIYWGDENRYSANTIVDIIMKRLSFPTKKEGAFLTIDDRAFVFEGEFPNPKELLDFKPWNRR